MNAKRTLLVVAGALGLVVGVHPALGELITFEFAGEITGVIDAIDLFGGGVTVGSPFSGTYAFESTTPDSNPASPNLGLYKDAISSIAGTAGAVQFLGPSESSNRINTGNGVYDYYFVSTDVRISGESLYCALTFWDESGTAMNSDELPLVPPDPMLFDSAFFKISNGNEMAPVGMAGEVRSLTLVPEPGTLTILAIGTLVVVRLPRGCLRNRGRPLFAPAKGTPIDNEHRDIQV